MLCPIKYNPAKYDECYYDCPWACITSEGYCCVIAMLAMNKVDGVGINFEPLPQSFYDNLKSEEKIESENKKEL